MPAAVDRDGVTRATAGNEVLIYEERAVVVVERALATHKPECVIDPTGMVDQPLKGRTRLVNLLVAAAPMLGVVLPLDIAPPLAALQ